LATWDDDTHHVSTVLTAHGAGIGILGQGQRVRIPPDAGDFRLMDKQVVDALIRLPERTRFMKGLYAWVGFKAEPMLYVPAERLHGQSHFNLLQLIRFAVDGITAFSTWPLRTFNLVGSLIAMLSFCYGSYLVIDYLINGHDISGWTTIVTGMFFFSGINLMALGTMGAYIARIFDEVKQRPLYVVKRNIGQQYLDLLVGSLKPAIERARPDILLYQAKALDVLRMMFSLA